jgi:hypothetical protein
MEQEFLGVLVAMYGGSYRHPTAERYLVPPTHYASAPLSEWRLSGAGSLVPPPGIAQFIGDKPEPAPAGATQGPSGSAGPDGRRQAVQEPDQLQPGPGNQRQCTAYRPGTGRTT